ncbi:MAG: acyltransferase [Ilumatobacter sp.]|uniref:acyltransferase n=1 Tax=Ilumatobacter sp. TaxID=1967498 RepID=UPI003C76D952
MLERDAVARTPVRRLLTGLKRAAGEGVLRGWDLAIELGAIGPDTRRGKRFGRFGRNSVICFPPNTLFNEEYIHIGDGTLFGPQITLSAGMIPGQEMVTDPVISVGDRCLFGKGSGIVGHLEIRVGNDVWTGHHVYITDQNHGYEDLDLPISKQVMPERPVSIGDGSWLGHGSVVLPGARIGKHVVVAANSVVTGVLPDNCVAAGVPARVIKQLG